MCDCEQVLRFEIQMKQKYNIKRFFYDFLNDTKLTSKMVLFAMLFTYMQDSLWMFFWAFDIIDKVLLNNGVFNGFASVVRFFLANTIIRYSDCQANKIIHGVLLTFIPSSQTSGIQWNINISSTAYDDIPIDYLEHFKGFIVCFMNARHAPKSAQSSLSLLC